MKKASLKLILSLAALLLVVAVGVFVFLRSITPVPENTSPASQSVIFTGVSTTTLPSASSAPPVAGATNYSPPIVVKPRSVSGGGGNRKSVPATAPALTSAPSPAPIPTPAPTSSILAPSSASQPQAITTVFPKDEQYFSISGGQTGPRLVEGYLNPFYPAPGDTQTLSVKAQDTSPITSLSATFQTDVKTVTHLLALSEGTPLEGLWRGSWKVEDTRKVKYTIILEAVSARGKSTVEITLK